jgi:hypothetical protein
MTALCELGGRGVLVTRPAAQAAELCRLIEAVGGRPIEFPSMEIRPPRDPDGARERLRAPRDLVIFISRNAVAHALALLSEADASIGGQASIGDQAVNQSVLGWPVSRARNSRRSGAPRRPRWSRQAWHRTWCRTLASIANRCSHCQPAARGRQAGADRARRGWTRAARRNADPTRCRGGLCRGLSPRGTRHRREGVALGLAAVAGIRDRHQR